MRHPLNLKAFFVPMGLALLLAGCAKIQLPAPTEPNATDWVQARSGAYIKSQQRLFYGIGHAAGSRNATLLRAAADNQARTEMERVLRTYFDRLIDAAGWQGEPDEKQQMIYSLSQAALQRARITEHRFDEPDETLFSLCSLSLTTVEETLQATPYVGTALKREMLGRAGDVYQAWAATQ